MVNTARPDAAAPSKPAARSETRRVPWRLSSSITPEPHWSGELVHLVYVNVKVVPKKSFGGPGPQWPVPPLFYGLLAGGLGGAELARQLRIDPVQLAQAFFDLGLLALQ